MKLPVILTVCVAALGMSCVTFHRYHVVPWETELTGGTVRLSAGPYWNANSSAVSDSKVDSGDELWCLAVDYRSRTLALSDLKLDLDSVSYVLSKPSIQKNIIRHQWGRLIYGDWSRIVIGPISLPADYRSDFKVDFILSVYHSSTGELLEERHLSVESQYRKEREFYWGR